MTLKKIQITQPSITQLEIDYVNDAIRHGWGSKCYDYIYKFQDSFAKYQGSDYALATSSCTGAIHLALMALGVKAGDEVIVPESTWIASVEPILYIGAKPVFVDIQEDTWCINPSSIETAITSKTKAIIAVHLYGNVCEMDEILTIAHKHNLVVLEDAAEGLGSEYKGKKCGSIGHAGVFSFHGTKTMSTGEGGILCTNSKKIYNFCKSFRSHGLVDRDTHKFLGYNYRMGELNAAIGRVQLKKIKKFNAKRIKNSIYLINKLKKHKNHGKLFEVQEPKKHIYHTYFWCPIRILKNLSLQSVKNKLKKKGIEIRSRYKYPLYKQKVFQNLKITNSQNSRRLYLPNAEKLSGNIFGLPNHYKLKKKNLDYIIETVGNLFE